MKHFDRKGIGNRPMLSTLTDDTMEIKGKEEASVFVYDWINQVISRDHS